MHSLQADLPEFLLVRKSAIRPTVVLAEYLPIFANKIIGRSPKIPMQGQTLLGIDHKIVVSRYILVKAVRIGRMRVQLFLHQPCLH